MIAPFIVLLLIFAFALLHSGLAGGRLTRLLTARMEEQAAHGISRLLYNAVALLTILPAVLLVILAPGEHVWQATGLVAALLTLLMLVGIAGIVVSVLQIDGASFAGTRQWRALQTGQSLPLPIEPLQVRGLYRLVRHPLYLFSMLALWSQPTMTSTMAAFALASTLYFIIGSRIEERRLIAQYGDDYLHYQQTTPWLLPLSRK